VRAGCLIFDEISATRVTGHLELGSEHHRPQPGPHPVWRVDLTDKSGRLIAHGELRLQNVLSKS
jgi:hypothetical protein